MRLIKDKPIREPGELLDEFAKRYSDWIEVQVQREAAKEQIKYIQLEVRIAIKSQQEPVINKNTNSE